MNEEERVKYTCHDCVHDFYCPFNEICDNFEKRRKIVLEVDGVRHALKPDVKKYNCYRCSLRESCFNKVNCLCIELDHHGNVHFELENNEE